MTVLTEFLLARLAEDEAAAQAALQPPAYPAYGENSAEETLEMSQNEGCSSEGREHFARWMPARVLAECDAKRRIVEEHRPVDTEPGFSWPCRTCEDIPWPCPTLRLLALPYADHPDFDPAWGF